MSRLLACIAILINLTITAQAAPFSALDTHRAPGWRVHPRENPDIVVCDLPPNVVEEQFSVPFDVMLQRQKAVPRSTRSDTITALVLLCQWEDDPADTEAHPPEAYDDVFFSQGMIDPGSLQEYFQEISYGSCWIDGEVRGWFTQPTYIEGLWFSDFFAAADPYVDYSDFDHDGDGYTDAVYVIHAGPGQEETHYFGDIWSFAFMYGYDYMTEDGVIIDAFACNPEEHADKSIITIRVACHEAAHVLGLPDLYDYDSKLDTTTYYTPSDANDHPLVDWCVMGYAGYNIMSYGSRQDPSHMCAWSKARLGFLTPVTLDESRHDIIVPEVELNPDAFVIPSPDPGSQEYFLVENRNSNSISRFDHLDSDFSAYFEWFTPGQNKKDPGLMIYHIDDAVSSNTSGPGNPHYMVIVEDAGYDPWHSWDNQDEFSEWWYPYEFRIGAAFAAEDANQTSFTPQTTPASDWYGGPSGIWLTNLSVSDSIMTFDLGFCNAWPVIVDYSPASLDTLVNPDEMLLFEVDAVDENGDALTYEWYRNAEMVQSGSSSNYWLDVGTNMESQTIMAVATDNELADSLTWIVRIDSANAGQPNASLHEVLTISASPMPSGSSITFRCLAPHSGWVRLTVHDAAGRLVSVLFDEYREAGLMEWVWGGTDSSGSRLSPGMYIARLHAGSLTKSQRIVLLR